jgi:hypothetical protein
MTKNVRIKTEKLFRMLGDKWPKIKGYEDFDFDSVVGYILEDGIVYPVDLFDSLVEGPWFKMSSLISKQTSLVFNDEPIIKEDISKVYAIIDNHKLSPDQEVLFGVYSSYDRAEEAIRIIKNDMRYEDVSRRNFVIEERIIDDTPVMLKRKKRRF